MAISATPISKLVTTCAHCGSKIRFEVSDIISNPDFSGNKNKCIIYCPTCSESITVKYQPDGAYTPNISFEY